MAVSPSLRRITTLSALLLAGTAWPALAQTAPAQTTPDQPTTIGHEPGPAQDQTGVVPAQPQSTTNPPAAAGSAYPPGVGGTPPTQTAEPATTENALAENQTDIVVTGYRQSLQSATNAKRNSTGFTDSIFAEDIGKFPDTNIAETFNRIPGITISREVSGEGVNVAIRGLGSNFTRVLLNNAPVSIASTGPTDAQGANRTVDLNLFPIELFTQLTVSKTPQADQVEGGAAGIVNMRSARPFDNPGTHITYNIQGEDNTSAGKLGYRGSVLASHTGGNFGILVGGAVYRDEVRTKGFETIGWTNANLTGAQCPTGTTCNTTGGGNFTIPGTVPANAGNGLTTGQVIDAAFLTSHNPGASIQQIDNGIIPRLGRPSDEFGRRDRFNFIASAEWRPSDSLHLYLDSMYGQTNNNLQRIDMDWVGRNGAVIPLNEKFDATDCSQGCVVNSGTFANSQFFLEYRPYIEQTKFYGFNPGGEWTIARNLKVNLQANYTHSDFFRQSPSVVVNTAPSSGVTVNYVNGIVPSITTNVDLNNPANFQWAGGGRVNLQAEQRYTNTKGVRGDLTFGTEKLALKVGGSYDDINRRIRAIDNSGAWQNLACGDNPSVNLPGPNTQPACNGLSITGTSAQVNALNSSLPSYPGYGQGYTAGATTPIVYRGSAVPQSQLAGYLSPGPDGFITVNFPKFAAATNYYGLLASAPEAGGANTGASGGYIDEKTPAAFAEVNGNLPVGERNRVQFNVGVRYVHTDQTIGGLVSLSDPRNATRSASGCPGTGNVADGSCYPNVSNFNFRQTGYDNWLPSASAAFHIGNEAVIRASVSRTMTRPDPSAELPGVSFTSPSADTGSIGNPALSPYISNNQDVGFEYYTGKEGYVGVAAFRKSITGFTTNQNITYAFSYLAQYGITYDSLTPTQQTAINARGGPANATVVLTQQVNAPAILRVNGLEFTWVQPLDFLLEKRFGLKGFGFSSNVTLVDQKYQGTGAPAVALGVSPVTYNVTAYYENHGITVRASTVFNAGAPAVALGVSPVTYNVTAYYENHGITVRASTVFNAGAQTAGTNQNGITNAALFSDDYQQYDISSSFDPNVVFGTKGMPELTFDVINLTNAAQRQYFQFPDATFTYYKPGTTFLFGIRGRF